MTTVCEFVSFHLKYDFGDNDINPVRVEAYLDNLFKNDDTYSIFLKFCKYLSNYSNFDKSKFCGYLYYIECYPGCSTSNMKSFIIRSICELFNYGFALSDSGYPKRNIIKDFLGN